MWLKKNLQFVIVMRQKSILLTAKKKRIARYLIVTCYICYLLITKYPVAEVLYITGIEVKHKLHEMESKQDWNFSEIGPSSEPPSTFETFR